VAGVNFETLDLFGAPFEMVETYVEYEGPRTFALRSSGFPDVYYFVNTVDEDDEDDTLTMLAVAVSGERFRAVRGGLVPFRAVFTEARWNRLSVIVWTFDPLTRRMLPTISPIDGSQLPERWLPTETAALNLPTDTVERYTPSYLVAMAEAQSRTVFAIEVEARDATVTEFPAKQAGELQIAVHREIDALARLRTPSRGVLRDIRPSFIGVQAASFVILLAIDAPDGMMEPTDVTSQVFGDLHRLIESAGYDDKSVFIQELTSRGSRVRHRFVDMLEPLTAVGSGITLWSSVAFTGKVERASLSPQDVRDAAEAIASVEPTIEHIEIRRGALLGLNIRLGRFEISDLARGEKYAGYMTPEAAVAANGLPVGDHSFVRATVRSETLFAASEADRVRFVLEDIARADHVGF
jgi:hypothetical protein